MGHRPTTDRYGFRYRGGENTRIEAFTDAAFAFAVTLLMIGGGHVPTDVPQLVEALRDVPAYAASFTLLCIFWHAHYRWYRRYGIEDGHSILLSLLLVFLVLIYIYPLHMMFGKVMWLSFSARQVRVVNLSIPDWRTLYVVFDVAYASMSLVILLFHVHAWRLRETLELDRAERAATRSSMLRWSVQIGVALLSAVLALTLTPPSLFAAPGLVYWLLALSGPVLRRRLQRQLATTGNRR